MDDFRRVLEHARDHIPMPDLPLEGVFRRRDRRRRNQRLAAGVLGLAIVVVGLTIGYRIASSPLTPADHGTGPGGQALRTAVFGLDGSLREEVSGLPDDAFGTQLSSDGERVTFITQDAGFAPCDRCVSGSPRLATMGLDGSDPRILVGQWSWLDTPSWSPDSSKIAFAAASGGDGNRDIYVIDSDGLNLRRLTTDPAVDAYPSWSPDGANIVYDNAGFIALDSSNFSVTQEIWSVPVGGGSPVRITHDRVGEKQAGYSPDGSLILVSRGAGGIWIMTANGTHARRVPGTAVGLASFSPRWSPDGSQVAFLTYRDDFRPEVRDPRGTAQGPRVSLPLCELSVVDLASGHVVPLGILTASDVNAPSWLPNGDAILIDRFTTS